MARQRLGQHFLSDPAWQHRILEHLPRTSDETWVEIGAGHGEMTRHLAKMSAGAGRTVAIETDATLAQNLRSNIAAHPNEWPGVAIVEADVLSLDLAKIVQLETTGAGQKIRVYGNLPYYITSPILHHLFRWADCIASIHIVIQLEVAERVAAKPGSRDYGYLSAACQFYTRPEIALKIPAGAFRPPPKVASALVGMTLPGERAFLGVADEAAFLKFIQVCFAHKRKTLRNNLRAIAPDERARKAILACSLSADVRAERLSLAQFSCLGSSMSKRDS